MTDNYEERIKEARQLKANNPLAKKMKRDEIKRLRWMQKTRQKLDPWRQLKFDEDMKALDLERAAMMYNGLLKICNKHDLLPKDHKLSYIQIEPKKESKNKEGKQP